MIARQFAKEGAKVIVADILDERAKGWIGELGEQGAFVHLDITKEEDWKRGVDFTTRKFGPPSVLVNNAAVFFRAPIHATPLSELERLYRVNVGGAFLGIKAMIEPMQAAGGGSIVNISSPAGLDAPATVSAYACSKWALRGLTRVAAAELGPQGIRVNAIMGGGGGEMVWPFRGKLTQADSEKLMRARGGGFPRLKPRPGTYTTATLAAFLASDESYQMHGQDFSVDSGRNAGSPLTTPELVASLGITLEGSLTKGLDY